jgi:hypothetical protein
LRKFTLIDGVLIPDRVDAARTRNLSGDYARDVVRRAVRKLAEMSEHGVAGRSSTKYLPRLAREYKLLEDLTENQFGAAMRDMQRDGALVQVVVGRFPNRNPREALALADPHK